MNAVIEAVFNSIASRTGLSLEAFEEAASAYSAIPIHDGDELIGGVMVKGAEVHVGVIRTPRGAKRGMFRKVLNDIVEKHGYVTTLVLIDNHAGIKFCTRLGFVEVARNDFAIVYRREKPCS